MLTSAAAPTPSSATPVAVDGASPETKAANASDFLALLGGGKAAGKKSAKVKSGPLVAVSTAKPGSTANNNTNPNSAGPLAVALADTAKPGSATKLTIVKTAGKTTEVTAEGEAAKAQQTNALPPALLAALSAGARAKDGSAGTAETALAVTDAPEAVTGESAKSKTKPVRNTARRDGGEPSGKADAGTKTSDVPSDAARAAKADAQPAIPQAATKGGEAPATLLHTAAPDAAPQGQTLVADPQVSETRIPLATREAAQAGFAAPVLAMRVITKDGVTKSIEIRLDPAELGQVDVKLETGHDGKLKAVLSAENADAFELLKKDSSALEAALRDAGVDLEEGAISFALNDSGADQSQQREAAYGGAEARRNARAEEIAAAAAATEASTWRNGVIDISV